MVILPFVRVLAPLAGGALCGVAAFFELRGSTPRRTGLNGNSYATKDSRYLPIADNWPHVAALAATAAAAATAAGRRRRTPRFPPFS
jgi:hypothetical protein